MRRLMVAQAYGYTRRNAPYEEAKRPAQRGGRIVHDSSARGKQQQGHHHRDACVWLWGTDALHTGRA